jgi:N-glycosylase/DNA lyase
LILSARYGFIDPDQPIERYDVTFTDDRTGPITNDALREQVLHQARWQDAIPLRQFKSVEVHGHSEYMRRVSIAFREIADVAKFAKGDIAIEKDAALVWSPERAERIGMALGRVPLPVFETLDRNEPEWPVLEVLAEWRDVNLGRLTAICLGITDYQLGNGGAAGYWAAVRTELQSIPVRAASDVILLMRAVCGHAVSSRLAQQKLTRVEKVVSAWPRSETERHTAIRLWHWLAGCLGQDIETKTVVMAMKTIDLLRLARDGTYEDFGSDIPLPVDLRIARLSLTSGLIGSQNYFKVDDLLSTAGDIASIHRDVLVQAWRAVAVDAQGLSLLRIDSLAWQVAGAFSDGATSAQQASAEMMLLLESAGCPSDVAASVASEFTKAL